MAIQDGFVEKMELEYGKLFIGGISWDTDEGRLKEYFSNYGEVIEAVIMRDRITGRARGFGFVVFADVAVADRVVLEKHMIDGRTVEAKKAVPREEYHGLNRSNGGVQGSPGPGARTKKIFVGGLASTVTESDFKRYFDQFGGITDVVVMYDHNTQRPRGFGFVTFDSEEDVDRVLLKTFHELNGKMVEVKRAVPRELPPMPNRSPLAGFNYGSTRPNSLFTSMSPNGGFGVRADSRVSPIGAGRSGSSPFTSSGYGLGLNLAPDYKGEFGSLSNNIWLGRVMSPQYGGSSNKYISPIGYNQSVRNESFVGSSTRNVWGNNGVTSLAGPSAYLGSGSSGLAVSGNGPDWGSSLIPTQGEMGSSGYNNELSIGPIEGPENNFGFALAQNGPNIEGSFDDLYRGSLMYGDLTWQSSHTDLDAQGPGPFSYGLHNS